MQKKATKLYSLISKLKKGNKMSLFTQVLNGMKENNKINGSQFSDWDNAESAIEAYGSEVPSVSTEEMAATVSALTLIIESSGEKIEQAVSQYNKAVWGQNFANNNGPVAFGG